MKHLILSMAVCMMAFSPSFAQQIEYNKSTFGTTFTSDGEKLSMKELTSSLSINPEASTFLKKGKSQSALATVLAAAGGIMVGWELGGALAGNGINPAVAGVGSLLILIGIPISSGGTKNMTRAVDLYNANLDSTTYQPQKTEIRLIMDGKGIGLRMKF
ncbi:MAG: hypothetical protein AAFY71_10330 [Bacteroidota bacterium]